VFDGSAAANYSNSTDYYYTVDNGGDGTVVVTFTELNFESGWDALFLCVDYVDYYDDGTADDCYGYTLSGDYTNQLPIEIVGINQSATFRQYSDGSLNYAGFIADWSYTYEISGCTDPLADNYNPDATIDDGTCVYPVPVAPVLSGQGGFTADGDPMMQLTHDDVALADYYRYYYYYDNLACVEASEATLGANSAAGPDEWFSYTATIDGTLEITTCV
jgi:hypothetical protein